MPTPSFEYLQENLPVLFVVVGHMNIAILQPHYHPHTTTLFHAHFTFTYYTYTFIRLFISYDSPSVSITALNGSPIVHIIIHIINE